jgi:hypothetical protein
MVLSHDEAGLSNQHAIWGGNETMGKTLPHAFETRTRKPFHDPAGDADQKCLSVPTGRPRALNAIASRSVCLTDSVGRI